MDRVVQSTAKKTIEILKLQEESSGSTDTSATKDDATLRRELIVRRASKELREGDYVNLGLAALNLLAGSP